jgi:hypothetical protein
MTKQELNAYIDYDNKNFTAKPYQAAIDYIQSHNVEDVAKNINPNLFVGLGAVHEAKIEEIQKQLGKSKMSDSETQNLKNQIEKRSIYASRAKEVVSIYKEKVPESERKKNDGEHCVYCGGDIGLIGSKCKSCGKANTATVASALIGGIIHTILTVIFAIILIKSSFIKAIAINVDGIKTLIFAFIPTGVWAVLMGITTVLFRQYRESSDYSAYILVISWIVQAVMFCIWRNATFGGWIVGLVLYSVMGFVSSFPGLMVEYSFANVKRRKD